MGKNSSIIGVVALLAILYLFRSQISALFSPKVGAPVQASSVGSLTSPYGAQQFTALFKGTQQGGVPSVDNSLPASGDNSGLAQLPGTDIFVVPGIDTAPVTYGQNQPVGDPFDLSGGI
jgi:hypothetical protein